MSGIKAWLYRGGRPNRLAAFLNRIWAAIHSLGVAPNWLVTLEVRGRRSGRPIRLPLVVAVVGGERYLVSMLGAEVEWVRNVEAAHGRVILHHGRSEEVLLEEVPIEARAPLIKRYTQVAPGGRSHIPVDKDAPLADFEAIAARFPVFRIVAQPQS